MARLFLSVGMMIFGVYVLANNERAGAKVVRGTPRWARTRNGPVLMRQKPNGRYPYLTMYGILFLCGGAVIGASYAWTK